ncbi:hypothetical protein L3X38_005166 [Prunus dulcis]|uniref:Uncharacterized protein n=1 Tax=Prunus dulcis TaxID=3755 RepID=A0AAD4ZQD5_PRUDU|nr:hypothetical protein L3X38_005166 [Prunus dulcis]
MRRRVAIVAPHCYCGKLARLQTSWTESNLLWRFFVCPKLEKLVEAEMLEVETNLVLETEMVVQTDIVVQTKKLEMVELVGEMVEKLG